MTSCHGRKLQPFRDLLIGQKSAQSWSFTHTEGDNGQAGHAEEFALKRRISSTAATVYTGVPGLLAGFLLQDPISFAYMLADRVSQDTFAFQPGALFSLGWLVLSCRHG